MPWNLPATSKVWHAPRVLVRWFVFPRSRTMASGLDGRIINRGGGRWQDEEEEAEERERERERKATSPPVRIACVSWCWALSALRPPIGTSRDGNFPLFPLFVSSMRFLPSLPSSFFERSKKKNYPRRQIFGMQGN